MKIYDVVVKLIGPIEPIGDSAVDAARFENLKEMSLLIDRLLADVDQIAVNNNGHQLASRHKAGLFAAKFFDEIGIVE